MRGFGLRKFFHGSGALNSDADHAAQSLKSGAREYRPGDADSSRGARTQMQWRERDSALRIDHRLATRTDHLKILQQKRCRFGVGAIDLLGTEQIHCGGFCAESITDIGGNRVQQFGYVIGGKETLAEGVKAFHIAAALNGVGGLAAGAVCELTGDSGGYEKGEERNPVLGVGDSEGSDGRKKIIIEGERGEYGEKNGEAESPVGRYPQHHQQERQCYGRWIYVNQTPVNLGHEFGGYKASDVAECVLWPVFFHGHDCNRKKKFSPQSHRDTEKASEREKKTVEVF